MLRRMATSLSMQSAIKLNSGHELPVLGFGVYKTPYDETKRIVSQAIETGYKHIDTAFGYRNQAPCAEAIPTSARPSIFFTSKIVASEQPLGYENSKSMVDQALSETGFDYLDLMLIHSPHGSSAERKGAWQGLAESVEKGKVRSIGISNYGLHHLQELEQHIKELEEEQGKGKGGIISVGQWEIHPWCQRKEIVQWCKERNIAVEAYSPIVRGQRFDEPVLQKLAKKYGKSPAQVLVRWSLQRGFVPLVKTVTQSRMVENTDVFGFELTEDEMEELATDEYSPCAWDPTTAPLDGAMYGKTFPIPK